MSEPTCIYAPIRAAEKLWQLLTRKRPKRGRRARRSKEEIAEKAHIPEQSETADARHEPGHWEADLVICKQSRSVLVLLERKTRITLVAKLTGKTAAETASALMEVFKRLSPDLRGSVTFPSHRCKQRLPGSGQWRRVRGPQALAGRFWAENLIL